MPPGPLIIIGIIHAHRILADAASHARGDTRILCHWAADADPQASAGFCEGEYQKGLMLYKPYSQRRHGWRIAS